MSYPLKQQRPHHGNGEGRKALQTMPVLYCHPNVVSTLADALCGFRQAMLDAGIGAPETIAADSTLHRFRGEGDRHGARNCWYVLHGDIHPAGVFGSWRTGFQSTWSTKAERIDPQEAARFAALVEAAKIKARAEREASRIQAANNARGLWQMAKPAAADHPYLKAKGVDPCGLRQQGVTLLVALMDATGTVHNLQRIYPDGAKRFLPGGRITGLHAVIGTTEPVEHLLICEGWATGATLHAQTGFPVWCAMNCGNLQAVSQDARATYPDADIVICGDDDRHTAGNPGRSKATEAAAAIGARLVFPTFLKGEQGTDFNDMAANRRRAA